MKKFVLLALFLVPAIVLASTGNPEESRYFAQTGRENDFFPRIVNFIIFASLIYYLVANPIKSFFKNRKSDIEGQLKEIENKLQAAKDEQKEAQDRLNKSEARALDIIADGKLEADLLANKIALANENDLVVLQKQFEEKMELEERKSARETINEVLNENLTNSDITLDEAKVIETISKKVA